MDDQSYSRATPQSARRSTARPSLPLGAAALGIAGLAAGLAAAWLYLGRAEPEIDERTRARLAPRGGGRS